MILKTFLRHEILSLIKSRRVYLTVLLFALLFVSVFSARVIDYQKQINQYLTDVHDAENDLQDIRNYSYIKTRAIHRPLIFSIYNQGFTFGRVINIQFYKTIDGSQSENEEINSFYYENKKIDMTFLVTFF